MYMYNVRANVCLQLARTFAAFECAQYLLLCYKAAVGCRVIVWRSVLQTSTRLTIRVWQSQWQRSSRRRRTKATAPTAPRSTRRCPGSRAGRATRPLARTIDRRHDRLPSPQPIRLQAPARHKLQQLKQEKQRKLTVVAALQTLAPVPIAAPANRGWDASPRQQRGNRCDPMPMPVLMRVPSASLADTTKSRGRSPAGPCGRSPAGPHGGGANDDVRLELSGFL